MATNFEPHECVIFVQSTKIGTHENKAIHSKLCHSMHLGVFLVKVSITFSILTVLSWCIICRTKELNPSSDSSS